MNTTASVPPFMATGIGSMPFIDPVYAVDLSLSRFREAPFWPQLPRLGYAEDMVAQYAENIPGIRADIGGKRVWADTSGDSIDALTQFYEQVIEISGTPGADLRPGAISREFAQGLYAFEQALERDGRVLPFVKVQTTGPCTMALGILDEGGCAVYYREEIRDVIVKALALKCRWQIRKFAPYAANIICFIDEPVLSAYGSSAYLGVKRDDVVSLIAETVEAIHAEGALAGIHCCGNTEWTIPIDAGVDIVNFDAFEYGETIALYHAAIASFLESGGRLAWGIVPTSDAIHDATVESLEAHLERMMDHLASKGIDKAVITSRSWITPACGTGSMAPADAERVFELTEQLADHMRATYTHTLARRGGGTAQ